MTRRRQRIFIGFSVVLGIFVLGALVASIALGAYVGHRKDQALAQLGARLGRTVTVGRVSTSLLRGAGVTADEVTIAGDPRTPGDQAPLFTAGRVRVRVALLRALASLGNRITITEITLEKPKLNVVRFPDGTLNVDRVAAQWERSAPPGPAQPMSARTRRMLESARIGAARITGGQLRFVDLQRGGGTAEITGLELALADVGVRARPSIHLSAAVMAKQPNLDLRAQLGAAGTLERTPPLESARLKLDRVDLRPLTPLLSRGAPFDAVLDADLDSDARKGDLNVRRLDVVVDDMSLVGHGRLESLTGQPRFEDFAVETRNLDFDRLRRAYPALDRRLGAVLHGPAELHASASGGGAAQTFTASADFTNASVSVPGKLDKPRGAALRIDVSGHARKDALESELKIQSRQSDLAGSLVVRNFARPQIDFRARSSYLDTADLMMPAASSEKQPPHAAAPHTVAASHAPGPMARVSGRAQLSVARGVASGVPFEGLETDLALKDGTLHVNKLDVGAWGGHFTGGGSELALEGEHGPFHLVGEASHVDAEQLLKRFGGASQVVRGRLTAKLDVRGRGTAPAELERTLAGTLDGTLDEAELLAFNLEDSVAGKLYSALPFHLTAQRVKHFTSLGTVSGQLTFADGAIVLTRPLTAHPPEGPLELTGRLYFDGRLDLTGSWQLSPAGLATLLGNTVHPSQPLELSLKLGGDLHHPTIGIPDLGNLAATLARDVGGLAEGAAGAAGKVLRIPGTQQAATKALKDLFKR